MLSQPRASRLVERARVMQNGFGIDSSSPSGGPVKSQHEDVAASMGASSSSSSAASPPLTLRSLRTHARHTAASIAVSDGAGASPSTKLARSPSSRYSASCSSSGSTCGSSSSSSSWGWPACSGVDFSAFAPVLPKQAFSCCKLLHALVAASLAPSPSQGLAPVLSQQSLWLLTCRQEPC